MALTNFFALTEHGEVILEKHWLGDPKHSIASIFYEETCKFRSPKEVPSVIAMPQYYLIHISRHSMYFVCAVKKEASPLLILELLHKIVDVFVEYFTRVDDARLREHFAIAYQLLDELVDGGFASTTEMNQLKEMIDPPSLVGSMARKIQGKFQVKENVASGVVTRTPWRRKGVKYVQNEIYFDLVEEIDAIIDRNGLVSTTSIFGALHCQCKLSGDEPDLTLTFNTPSVLSDASLHRCVRLAKFQREKTLYFVPPDGQFQVMSYRLSGTDQLPIYVRPELSAAPDGKVAIRITVGRKADRGKPVEDVSVEIPFPASAGAVSLRCNHGSFKHNEVSKMCVWTIGRLPDTVSPELEGTVQLPAGVGEDERPVLRVNFAVKQFSISGLRVDALAVTNVPYKKPFKGVRSVTRAGRVEVRM